MTGVAQLLCSNTCSMSFNQNCDFYECARGTDCFDCGAFRLEALPPSFPDLQGLTPSPPKLPPPLPYPPLIPLGVVGGFYSKKNEYPFVVSFPQQHICGGVLIHPKWVLTAAHCVDRALLPDIVRVGLHTQTDDKIAQSIPVRRVVVHPLFSRSPLSHDIGLIELEHASISIEPVIIGELELDTYTVAGWGHTSFGGTASDILKYAYAKTIPLDVCRSYYESFSFSDWLQFDVNVCTEPSYTSSSCQGDSGGPLFKRENSTWIVLGLVSWQYGCATDYPTVYTRISPYLDWICQYVSVCETLSAPTTPPSSPQPSETQTIPYYVYWMLGVAAMMTLCLCLASMWVFRR